MKGTFDASPVSWGITKSSTGKERAEVVLQLKNEPVRRTWYGYFATPENAERTLESLEFMGWDGKSLKNLKLDPNSVVSIVIEEETYEGKIRDKVQWINKIRTVENIPVSDIDALEARVLKGRVAKVALEEKFDDPFALPAHTGDDDIPF